MSASNSSSFKVIVVGGGPVGLTAAHALTRAGIDFVVLESRPSIVIDAGSNLVLQPNGLRLMGQLGLLEAFNKASSPLGAIHRYSHAGRDLGDANWFVFFKENTGIAPRVVSRHNLTKVLFEGLPAESQAKMHANKKVSTINKTADGVVVNCTDGTSYAGSMIIGADGAHSLVRRQMRELAIRAEADPALINEEQPFLTTYRAMWVRFPTQADLQPGNANETHGRNAAVQLFAGEETTVIGIYETMEEPTRERARYGPADEEAFIQRWGHLPISRELTIRDAYESRVQAGMVNLEEGVVANWSWDRIVLVGDAAHKFTPSTGAGCNNGIVDIAVLINELHHVFAQAEGRPAQEDLATAFAAYQDARHAAVSDGCVGAGRATASATWQSGVFKFVDTQVLANRKLQKYFSGRGAQAIARTPVLDFIQDTPIAEGKIPWVHQAPRAVKA